ncbi:MAG: hypothetical protein WCL14_00085 [Bacteroidota bacterium]
MKKEENKNVSHPVRTVNKIAHMAGHNAAVYCIEKGNSENRIFTGSSDQAVIEWDLKGEQPPKVIANVGAIVYSLCFITENNYLIIGDAKGGIHILDMKAKRKQRPSFYRSSPSSTSNIQRKTRPSSPLRATEASRSGPSPIFP